MEKKSLKFLERLMSAPSPSGFEQPAQAVVKEYMSKYADEVQVDVMGNVIGIKNPAGKPKVMFAGHADEIGLMVKYITDEGFIYFAPIGGIDAHIVPGQRVRIHNERGVVLGIVGKKPIHLIEEKERDKVVQLHQQWIDIGIKDKKEAEKLVSVGDPITFAVALEYLQNDLVVSRGFDDKMGSFVVVETLRLLAGKDCPACVYAVSTVQEELGTRGAQTSAFQLAPDVGIAIDVDHATDHPDMDKHRIGEKAIGKGPVLHRGANINPKVGKLLVEAAKEEKIPFQLSGEPGATPTDARVIQVTRGGVAAALVSVPLRYMHTPCEVLSLVDLENTAKLLAAFVARLTEDTDFTP